MNKIINVDNIRQFAYLNDEIIDKPIKGIVLTLNGLSFSNMFWDNNDEISKFFAENGILQIIPYYNPWSWMNDTTVNLVDELVDITIKKHQLSKDISIVSTGRSMGGLSALVYSLRAKYTPIACITNCPVCDLEYHSTERNDVIRTLYSAYGHYSCTIEEAIKNTSPIHLIDQLPKIEYHIFHCEEDQAVNKQKHSDIFVEEMLKRNYDIKYYSVPGRGHCDLTPEANKQYHQLMVDAINKKRG